MKCPHCDGHIDVEKYNKIAEILERAIWDFDRTCESNNSEYVGVAELPNGITVLLLQGNAIYAERVLKVIKSASNFLINDPLILQNGHLYPENILAFCRNFQNMSTKQFMTCFSRLVAETCFDHVRSQDPKTHGEIQNFAGEFLEHYIRAYQLLHERMTREN